MNKGREPSPTELSPGNKRTTRCAYGRQRRGSDRDSEARSVVVALVVVRFTVGYSWTPFFWLPEVDFTGVLRSLHAASNAGAFPLHKSCLLLRSHSATMVALFGEPSPGGNVGIVIFRTDP